MSWLAYALFSAIVIASQRVYEKKLTGSFGNFSMGFVVTVFSLLPTLALFLFFPLPENIFSLSWQFWWPLILIWLILYPIQTYFMYRAIREGELSEVTPIIALLPVFSTLTSFVLIGEKPSLLGFIGIVSIVFGTYLLLTGGEKKEGKKKYNRAVIFMIFATICIAIGSALDKISIGASTPVFYSFVNKLGAAVIFFILTLLYKENKELGGIKEKFFPLFLFGVFGALSYTASMFAFADGPVAYVLAARSASFLFAAFLAVLILKEKFSLRRFIAFVAFVVGIILITILG